MANIENTLFLRLKSILESSGHKIFQFNDKSDVVEYLKYVEQHTVECPESVDYILKRWKYVVLLNNHDLKAIRLMEYASLENVLFYNPKRQPGRPYHLVFELCHYDDSIYITEELKKFMLIRADSFEEILLNIELMGI
jgi:hypothetical protein